MNLQFDKFPTILMKGMPLIPQHLYFEMSQSGRVCLNWKALGRESFPGIGNFSKSQFFLIFEH